MTSSIPIISAQEVRRHISPTNARKLIEETLLDGFDPAEDVARTITSLDAERQVMFMPTMLNDLAGIKVGSIVPRNIECDVPRIQALYILMDAQTLTPKAILEGTALTALRTPAVTAVACDYLAAADASELLVFGSGPQAVEHVIALNEVRELKTIRLVARNRERLQNAVQELAAHGIQARLGSADDVASADIVVCATSASEPLFDGDMVTDGACVAAIGSHESNRRELSSDLVSRSFVVVEDVATALREAGDVIIPINDGSVLSEQLHPLAKIVLGEVQRQTDRPNVFKGSGMSWEDLAVAKGISHLFSE